MQHAMYRRELLTFITAADKGSFLQTAEVLYTTPASVMNQINKLEAAVGVKLLQRSTQGVSLTAAGRVFYQDCQEIIRQCDAAVARARQTAEPQRQIIRIGTSILRPCRILMQLLSRIDDGSLPFSIRVVSFDDSPSGMQAMLKSIGQEIDCFAGPCDSTAWQSNFNILHLQDISCAIGVPRRHRLSGREGQGPLSFADLQGETLLLVQRGHSPVLDALRDDLEKNHPEIRIQDLPHFYDLSSFNTCVNSCCLMETLELWQDVHPGVITMQMQWPWRMPLGMVYSKTPSAAVMEFAERLKSCLSLPAAAQSIVPGP